MSFPAMYFPASSFTAEPKATAGLAPKLAKPQPISLCGRALCATQDRSVYRQLVYRRAVGEGRAGPEIGEAVADLALRPDRARRKTVTFTANSFTAEP